MPPPIRHMDGGLQDNTDAHCTTIHNRYIMGFVCMRYVYTSDVTDIV